VTIDDAIAVGRALRKAGKGYSDGHVEFGGTVAGRPRTTVSYDLESDDTTIKQWAETGDTGHARTLTIPGEAFDFMDR
jgi:hypothetical protein